MVNAPVLEGLAEGSNFSVEDVSPVGVPRYLVATPYWGALDVEHLDCVLAFRALYPEPIVRKYRITGCAYIDIARATAAAAAIDGGFDGLFFIDHDIIFDPRDAVALMRQAHRLQTVVYSLYSMRSVGRRMIGEFDPAVESATFFRNGGLYPGRYGGCGFCAIPRQVLLDVGRDMAELTTGFGKVKPLFALRSGVPDWPELFEGLLHAGLLNEQHNSVDELRAAMGKVCATQAEGWYAGEDISFFHRVVRAGYEPTIDTRPRIWHKGTYKYGLEDVQVVVPRGDQMDVTFNRTDEVDPIQAHVGACAEQFEGVKGPTIGPQVSSSRLGAPNEVSNGGAA